MENLKKGALDVVILSILEHEDHYGLEIIDHINARTSDAFHFKSGALYPVFHRLEAAKLLTSRWTDSHKGGARKYYHITKKGKKILEKRRAEWNAFRNDIDTLVTPA